MYALVEYKGKQYKAEKGAQLQVDLIDAEKGSKIDIDTVLMVSNDGKATVGTPYVKGAKVQVVVGDSMKDDKVIVYKYKTQKRLSPHDWPSPAVHLRDRREYRRLRL